MRLTAVILTLVLATPVQAQNTDVIRANYTKREVMIPMRDGVRLFTTIYAPKTADRPRPMVLTRTPYSVAPYGADSMPRSVDDQTMAYARLGYIIVRQDVRGAWMSEGEFVNVRPVNTARRSKRDIDETTDTYDTADWLVKNVPNNNGRIGIRGTSYPGFYSSMGAISGHPAIKAVSPQAPVTEWMAGDDFFHNGALLLPHAFDFYAFFGHPRPKPTSEPGPGFDHGTPDGYQFFLRLGALRNVNPRYFHGSVAFWDTLTAHGQWDDFWAARSARPHLRNLKPAMLWVGGWFDTENLWGALNAYAAAERQNPGIVNRLVMGPWSHGQWNRGPATALGAMSWDMPTATFFTDSLEVPFFNHYLDDGPAPRNYEAALFETGANTWRFFDLWPPRERLEQSWYLRPGGGLSTAPAPSSAGYDEYRSDPARPVPYTAEIANWYNPGFMVEDQRFASRRPDVLVYQTEPLAKDLTIAGPITVDLVVSTSGTDADWVVKLIDVFPDNSPSPNGGRSLGGYEMLLRGDVMRGKFRNDRSRPEPFVPDSATSVKFVMNDALHTFRAGHRIMVQVQSTWFPMVDRNPGRFMDIYQATDADFQATTQRVYRSAERPSRLILPVLPR
jgi:putative CocE/NonD family hydrolase